MSSNRFVAVPVGKGDAFFFEHEGERYLVDGGQSVSGFTEMFRAATDAADLKVLVCTHADADHANGVLGLLRAGAVPVEEVWLPGRWTDRLSDLLRDPLEFYDEVARDCSDVDAGDLESLGTEVSKREESDRAAPEIPPRGESDRADSLVALSDLIADAPVPARWPYLSRFSWELECVRADISDSRTCRLFAEAVDTGERIRRIYRWAVDRGARIRWFDFELFARSGRRCGGNTVLTPVNSVELSALPSRRPSALDYLALSVANRESLVFSARFDPNSASRGILFTADSDLAFDLPNPAPESVIATAPHHGAESNAVAYEKVGAWVESKSITWVRSDSATKTRPGHAYRSAPGRRFCTLCNPPERPKARVVLTLDTAGTDSESPGCCCPAE